MSLIAQIAIIHLPPLLLDSYGSRNDQAQVNIEIYNAATGQLTNGNYCQVTYRVTEADGSFGTATVSISGMKQKIFAGTIGQVRFDSNGTVISSTYKNFQVMSITGGGVDNPVADDELSDLVVDVRVDTPESAPGAKDGRITVVATSSSMPIAYKLDGVITAASPVFTGLSGGNHTIVVTDAAGNTITKTVFIPTSASLLLSDPSVTLPGGNISRWNAAFNPVVFTYQRRDFAVADLALNTADGNTRVSIDKDISSVKPDEYIYLQTEACSGIFKVKAIYDSNTLVIDTPFNSLLPGDKTGFVNINSARPYYKIYTRISFFDKLTGKASSIRSTNRPNNEGIVRADVSNFLQSLLRARDASDYALSNYRDDDLSASYQVEYAQAWDDANGNEVVSAYIKIAPPYYVLYAAKQLGDKFGGNLAAYVPFANVPSVAAKAKWVTDFQEPAYSNGYPFDIGFIYSEDLVGRALYAEFTTLDINRNPLPGTSATYLLNDDGSWLLNSEGGRMVIARQSMAKVPVPAQLGLNRLLIDGPFPDDVYYLDIALKYDDNSTTYTVTETQTIRIDDAVDDNSVYLRWIGLSGSWNYYRFVFNQEFSLDVQNAVIIKNYVTDWQNQEGIDEVISKSAGQKVKVSAEDLSVNDIKGLQSIKYSPKVQMLINRNPVKWQTVVVNTANYAEYETRNGQAPFSITFSLPAINVQVQ